jgi:hypothetical protein
MRNLKKDPTKQLEKFSTIIYADRLRTRPFYRVPTS